jgi:hypothetical protein
VAIVTGSVTGTEAIDLDALEASVRAHSLAIGRSALETGLRVYAANTTPEPVLRECGHAPQRNGKRKKTIHTVLGPIAVQRPYYHDAACGCGQAPLDRLLDVEETSFSPGLRNMMANVGSDGPFDHGAAQLARLAGVEVTASSIERVCARVASEVEAYRRAQLPDSDVRALPAVTQVQTLYILADGTGVPVLKRETAGRKGKGVDGQARTRELKLGCVFTQTRLDADGYPVRDEDATSYVVGCETAERFGERLEHEACVRGIDQVRRVCVIADGAAWIWNMVADRFPRAISVIDLYHAREHYAAVARLAFPGEDNPDRTRWCDLRSQELDRGDVSGVIRALQSVPLRYKAHREERDRAIVYFQNNAARMQYHRYRALGLFVGSGVVEAGCRTVVCQRLKQSGMHWTVNAAQDIAVLRALMLSQRWDDFWESRVAA